MSNGSGTARWVCSWLLGLSILAVQSRPQETSPQPAKRRVTVRDAIEMTRWADRNYFLGGEPEDRVSSFSPDGTRFLIVLKKGNWERNTNDYSLLLFRTSDAFRSAKPQVLLTMSSSSNRDAISHVQWLNDNETIAFLGENPGEMPVVYSFNIETRRLERLTNHPSPVLAFDISRDGREIVYEAAANRKVDRDEIRRVGIVITSQNPSDLLNCGCDPDQAFQLANIELFLQRTGQAASRISTNDFVKDFLPLSLSPTGRYVLLSAYVRDVPPAWGEYQDAVLHPYIMERHRPGTQSNVRRYLLLDTNSRELTPLLDAPTYWANNGFAWAPDGNSLVVSGTYLPLDVADQMERKLRERQAFVVEVKLPGKEIVKITGQDLKVLKWDAATGKVLLGSGHWWKKLPPVAYEKIGSKWKQAAVTPEDSRTNHPLEVTLEEDINTPPRVFVAAPESHQKALLVDLNPQFAELQFGKVEAVTWKATDGHEVVGGLYLPPDYSAEKRYPLVIQTHGFKKDRFWIDGPWSSAFAAQPLAAQDIVVLQVGGSSDLNEDLKYSNTVEEAPRQMAAYEGATDYLDGRGLIDRSRVGIIGFSRTVFYVEYGLTHSKYSFRAASLADGFDGGYINYILWPNTSYALVNGGPPEGSSRALWLKNSPGFNLNHVASPVHLEYYGPEGFLGGWQWFSGLSLLEKPVEFIWLPDGTHLLVKPWDRMASQQRNVDWFRFWLKDEEDPDPAKAELYKGWEELRTQVRHNGNTDAQSSR